MRREGETRRNAIGSAFRHTSSIRSFCTVIKRSLECILSLTQTSLSMRLTSPVSRTLLLVRLSEFGCLFHFLPHPPTHSLSLPPLSRHNSVEWSSASQSINHTQSLLFFFPSFCQGSQDAMGAQEGLVPPPYSSFPPPPPPPPQNGLPLDFGGSGIYPAGGQGQVEAPAGITNPPSAPSTLNTQVSVLTRVWSIW